MPPDFPLTQGRQRLLLFLRAFQAIDIDRLTLFSGKPVPQGSVAGTFTLTKHNRQGVEQDIADGVMVVICRPQQEPPDAGGENGLAVQYLRDGFQLIEWQFALIAHRHHNPNTLLFAKWHGHATARFGAHAVRQQIVKGAGKRNGQGNVSDGHRIFLT